MADQEKKNNQFYKIREKKESTSSSEDSFKTYEEEMGYDEIKKILDSPRETFSEMLLRLMDRKETEEPYLKDSDICTRAMITSSHFSKIKKNKNYNPKKGTVIAFAFALELPLKETKKLLLSAGYGLSKSKKEDLVVRYFIKHKRYSVPAVEEALEDFQLSSLGRP